MITFTNPAPRSKRKHYVDIRYCDHCKTNLLTYKQVRFCSVECQRKGTAHKNLICKRCARVFYPKSGHLKAQFCSGDCWHKYKTINRIGLRTGIPHSEEDKLKMSQAQKKRYESSSVWNKGLKGYKSGEQHWTWGKKRPEISGNKNPRWKGGVAKDRRLNSEYTVWRTHVFSRDNYTCQICDAYGGCLQADHIKSYADYPELRYEVSNGRTLCMACHYYVTFKRKMPEGIVWGITNRRIGK